MNESTKAKILEAVAADEAEMVAFTKDLVAIATENPPGALYKECIDVISDKLSALDLAHEVFEVPTEPSDRHGASYPRYAIVGSHGGGDAVLYFHGHYDVVPRSSSGQCCPFVRDGALYGRGSSDMKSGLASMIYAMKAAKACNIPLSGAIGLTIVPDEETGGRLGSKYLADIGVLGRDGVGMLTAEPTSDAIWNASRGAVSLRVTVKGKPVHVGLQYEGVNAFERMVAVANRLAGLKEEVESRVTQYDIRPEPARRSILMLGGRCEGGSSFNLVPGECSFTVDRRINPEEDLEVEKSRLLGTLDGLKEIGIDLDREILQEGESAGVPANVPVARALARNVEAVRGKRPAFEMCPGLLEIRFYAARGIPAFAYGPGLLSVSHGPEEYVRIKDIVDCAAVYALTAVDVLSD